GLVEYLQDCIVVSDLDEAWRLVDDRQLFAQYPNLRIATKQGHLITNQWLEIRGVGNTSTLEQRAIYERARADAVQAAKELQEAQRVLEREQQSHDALKRARQEYDPVIQDLQSRVTTLRERITLQKRNLEQQRATLERKTQQQE